MLTATRNQYTAGIQYLRQNDIWKFDSDACKVCPELELIIHISKNG